MSSPGFEPRPYGTAVDVANHYTGWGFPVPIKIIKLIYLKEEASSSVKATENHVQLKIEGKTSVGKGEIEFPPLSKGKMQPFILATCIDDFPHSAV
ncbi:hypothetical protein TNCV_301341 [Trichonephila clavipes]|nr:hypothetical protein TNCV_301341 [Trichonephila clavipes]